MANKIFKYDGFDTSTEKIIDGFEPNNAYILSEEDTIVGYTDITGIISFDEVGPLLELKHFDIKHEIEALYDENQWSGYTSEEKIVLSKYFIADKAKRDEVLTQEEQDAYNHFVLYHHISDDVVERMGGELDYTITPKSIDYKKDLTNRLHPKNTFNEYGYLVESEYFEELNITTNALGFHEYNFSKPVLKYEANYTSGSDGYTQSRVVTRSWVLADGTYSPDVKVSVKIYDAIISREEAKRRRKNLVNSLLVDIVGLIIMTSPDLNDVDSAERDAMSFMHDIESAITSYYESGSNLDANGNECQLVREVSVHPYSRLNNFVPGTNNTVTIRMFLINKLKPEF